MDWKKAKNYTIIFLLLLNAMLFVLNIVKYNRYGLSPNQEKAVVAVLEKNNITLEADIPTTFMPMAQLELKNSAYDSLELQRIFFGENKNIKRTEEFEKTIFSFQAENATEENEILTINSNNALYENNNAMKEFKLDEKSALKLTEPYVKKIGEAFTPLTLFNVSVYDDYICVEYDFEYLKKKLFNNRVTFKIYPYGKLQCQFSYLEPIQMTGEKTDICSADEALFSFYKGISGNYPEGEEKGIKIIKMDLGYYSEDYLNGDSQLIAVPHYRIYIKDIDEPYFINAYNGNMVFN